MNSPSMSPHPEIRVVLLSGRSGVGKSTVAYELSHKMKALEISHIHVDGDNLDAIYPAEKSSDLMLMNLHALWASFYHARSCHNLLLSGTAMILEHQRIRQVIEDVCRPDTGYVNMTGILLTASYETADTRLRHREIGGDLERHLQSSSRMSGILENFQRENSSLQLHTIVNEGKSLSDVADEILRVTWLEG